MQGNEIHIVASHESFLRPDGFIGFVRGILGEFAGKDVILLFGENIFNTARITRAEGKRLARELHAELARHGKAYAAYSVFEWPHGSGERESIVNTGYLIAPDRKEAHGGYFAYPKLTTFGKGQELTVYDTNRLKDNAKNFAKSFQRSVKLVAKVRRLPAMTINGVRTQLRVCADLLDFGGQDKHRAKGETAHLVLTPASGLKVDKTAIQSIAKALEPEGIAVVMDRGNARLKILNKTPAGMRGKFKFPNEWHEIGRFRIVHRHK